MFPEQPFSEQLLEPFQSWQLSEDFSMVMDMTMLMYLVSVE